MKRFMRYVLGGLFVLFNSTSVYAMEAPAEQYIYLKSTIADLQKLAEDLSYKSGFGYDIVTLPTLVKRSLDILGLTYDSTPLDIRYHYKLMAKKLLNNDALYKVVTKAYNQLIAMLSAVGTFKSEIDHLLAMSFEDLQAMELEGKKEFMYDQFLQNTESAINKAIELLKKKHRRYLLGDQVSDTFTLPLLLQNVFRLSVDASSDVVDQCYKSYMEKNDRNKLIALERMKEITSQSLKAQLAEVEKVKKTYAEYLQKREQG